MKIVVCWSNIAGYTAACWRALAAKPGVQLHVVCFRPADNHQETRFQESLLGGISHRFLAPDEIARPDLVASVVTAEQPDVVLVSGWGYRCFFDLPYARSLSKAKFILAMDTPWRGDLRQQLGRFFLSRHAQRMAAVLVAGEKARRYARRLGVAESRLHRGLYAYDESLFNERTARRRVAHNESWPRRFLFVGRYVPEKSIDTLVKGYDLYRRSSADPWPLDCCGTGPLKRLIEKASGINDRGFVQPERQEDVFAESGVLVLPSRYEPWGVVMAEAMASGMPVICTSACGSAAELLRPYVTGLEISPENPKALADAFAWMDAHRQRLPHLGENAMQTARPFGSDRWADRLDAICKSLLNDGAD